MSSSEVTLSLETARQALKEGRPMEYRRTPHTDWMPVKPDHQFNRFFYYRLKGIK